MYITGADFMVIHAQINVAKDTPMNKTTLSSLDLIIIIINY